MNMTSFFLHLRPLCLLALAILLAFSINIGQPSATAMDVPSEVARQAGLTVMWRTQIQTDPTRDRIVEMALHVHDDKASSYYEIVYGPIRETVSFDDLNPV